MGPACASQCWSSGRSRFHRGWLPWPRCSVEGKAPGGRVFGPIERLIYRVCRVDPDREQRWTVYAYSVLAFSVVGAVLLYGIQRLQTLFPLNPTNAPQVRSRPVVQHFGELPDQHQLAELLPRDER